MALIEKIVDELKRDADRMRKECKSPPCLHAWGIDYSITRIKALVQEHERKQRTV